MFRATRPLAALATISVLALSTPALASYEVTVNAFSRAGHAGDANCQYNGNGVNGCSNVNADPSSTGSVVTKGGNGGLATIATANTYQTGVDYGQTAAETTNMFLSSDLTSGSLHLASSNLSGSPSSSYGSDGMASLSDVLHFSVAGASATTVTPITVSFAIDGTMVASGANAPNTGTGEFYGVMVFGSSSASYDFLNNASTGYKTNATLTNANYYSGNSGSWTSSSDFSNNYYTETYNIIGAGGDISVLLRGTLSCYNGASCNYGDTAKIGIVAPAGTSYTSDSGVFLTAGAVAGAVPEPAAWAMMIVGFGAVGAGLRRRRTQGKLALA